MTTDVPVDPVAKAELAPEGALRAGLVEAPSPGLIFVSRRRDGGLDGVTALLAGDLAAGLGLALAPVVFPNSGALAAALQAGAVDVGFMPVDETRRRMVAFGPGYYDLESTYLASAASGFAAVADVDRPGARVVAIDGTTTFRASSRTLTHTRPEPVDSVAEAIARMRDGRADALALSRDTLRSVVPQVPGSRIVSGGFQHTQVAVAVPPDRPAALACVGAWLDAAKRSGLVRRAFDAHGFADEPVAA